MLQSLRACSAANLQTSMNCSPKIIIVHIERPTQGEARRPTKSEGQGASAHPAVYSCPQRSGHGQGQACLSSQSVIINQIKDLQSKIVTVKSRTAKAQDH